MVDKSRCKFKAANKCLTRDLVAVFKRKNENLNANAAESLKEYATD